MIYTNYAASRIINVPQPSSGIAAVLSKFFMRF